MANNRLKVEDYFERQAIALEAIAEANKEYTITVDMKDTEGNEVTNENVIVSNPNTGVVLYTIAYNGAPVSVKLRRDTNVKITGSTVNPSASGVFLPSTVEFVVQADKTANVVYKKFNQLKSLAALQIAINDNPNVEILPVGTVISVPYTLGGVTYNWDFVIRRWGKATAKDGSTRWGAYLYAAQSLPAMQYDAVENVEATEETAVKDIYYYGLSGSNYTLLSLSEGDAIPYADYDKIYKNAIKDVNFYCSKYGYQQWSHSAIHQYINSDKPMGEWWEAQHVGDCAPSNANSSNGMLLGFSEADRNALTAIKVKTALNTSKFTYTDSYEYTYDKMWMPSLDEFFAASSNGEDSNNSDYWYKYLGIDTASDNATTLNGLRKLPLINNRDSYQYCWLRSCYRGSNYVWRVNNSGSLYSSHLPGSTCCVAPACFIG